MVAGGNYKTIINCCIGISSVVAPHTDHPLIKDGFATDAILWHLMHINKGKYTFHNAVCLLFYYHGHTRAEHAQTKTHYQKGGDGKFIKI